MFLLNYFFSGLVGFLFFLVFSHPKSSVNKRLPTVRIKVVQVLPSVKIVLGGKTIHIHHWLYISVILVVSFVYSPAIFESMNSRGFLLGSIFQGIIYSDWKKIVNKH